MACGGCAGAVAAPTRVWGDSDRLSDVIDAVAPAKHAPRWKAKLSEEDMETVRNWKALSSEDKAALGFTAGLISNLNAALDPPPAPAPAAPGAVLMNPGVVLV